MSYNVSFMDTSNTIFDLIENMNVATNGFYFLYVLFSVFILIFLVSRTENINKKFILASFLTTIISALSWFAGLIAWYLALIPLTLLVMSIIMEYFS